MILLALAAVALLAVFLGFATHVGGEPAHNAFSVRVAESAGSLRSPWLDEAMRYLTLLGNGSTMTVLTLLAVMLLAMRGLALEAWLVGATSLAGSALVAVLKVVIGRPRPPGAEALIRLPESYAFPSGHAFQTMLLAALLAGLVVRRLPSRSGRWLLAVVLVSLAVLVALSRVYLGVHWATDVLGSWALAQSCALTALAVYVALGSRSVNVDPEPGDETTST